MCDRRVNQLKGQSLAAINHAAGVNVNLDRTHKWQHLWSRGATAIGAAAACCFRRFFSVEDRVRNAKLAIDFKLSQWLPLHERRKTGGAVNSQSNQALALPASIC